MYKNTTCTKVYEYKSDEDSEELVFCIREPKALLSLCDTVEGVSDLLLLFCGTGSPIKFSMETSTFTVSLIMATLEAKHLQTQQQFHESGSKRSRVEGADEEAEKDDDA